VCIEKRERTRSLREQYLIAKRTNLISLVCFLQTHWDEGSSFWIEECFFLKRFVKRAELVIDRLENDIAMWQFLHNTYISFQKLSERQQTRCHFAVDGRFVRGFKAFTFRSCPIPMPTWFDRALTESTRTKKSGQNSSRRINYKARWQKARSRRDKLLHKKQIVEALLNDKCDVT
jgi:hypothetical protein